MSNAERQRQYRLRKKLDKVEREYRLNTYLEAGAATSLRLLTAHHGLSQKAMLEKLIKDAQRAIADSLEPGTSQWCKFFQYSKARTGQLI